MGVDVDDPRKVGGVGLQNRDVTAELPYAQLDLLFGHLNLLYQGFHCLEALVLFKSCL